MERSNLLRSRHEGDRVYATVIQGHIDGIQLVLGEVERLLTPDKTEDNPSY